MRASSGSRNVVVRRPLLYAFDFAALVVLRVFQSFEGTKP